MLNPDDYEGLLERGFQKLYEGLPDEALIDFESVVFGAPDYGGGYYGIGLCHKVKGDTIQAAEYFRKAVKKDVFFGPAFLELGDLQFTDNIEDALKNYRVAEKLMPESAEPLYRLGLVDLLDNKVYRAKRKFKKALVLEPLHFQTNYMMGRLFFIKLRGRKAAEYFTNCMEVDPENAEIFVWRAVCNMIRKKEEAALQDLSSALVIEPENMLLYTMRGALKYDQKAYLEAAEDFSQTFLLSPPANSDFKVSQGFYPQTEEFKFLLSLILDTNNFKDKKQQEDLAQAVCALLIQKYQTAIAVLKPYLKREESTSNFIHGVILEKTRRTREALESYELCEAGSPVYTEAQKRIGFIKFEILEDYPSAYPIFQELTQQDSTYVMGYKYKGIIHTMNKEYESAIAEFSQAIKYDSIGSDLYFNRASCLLALNQQQEGLTDFERVVQLKPEDAESWQQIGDVKLSMGDTIAAKESYALSLKFKYNSELFFKRGLILLTEKNYLEAIEDFKKIETYSPNFEAARLNISNCLYFLKEYQQAITFLNAIIERNSKEPKAYFLRGLCYLRQQKQEEADYNFKLAKSLGMEAADPYIRD